MMGSRPRTVVMGGSLGGLTAALTLRDAGCEVEVYERSRTPLVGQGAGIVLHPVTVRYFTENAILDISRASVTARWVRYMGRAGDIIDEKRCPYRFSSFNALYQGLLDCFDADRYHLGEAIVSFEQDDDGVNIQCASGRNERADLLVCADGIRSTARRRLQPDAALEYAGYIAWRGTVDEAELGSNLFSFLRDAITYHIMPDGHFLTYPIPVVDGASGLVHPCINWLWYRNIPKGPELDDLVTDRDGVAREASVSPGMVQERHRAQLLADAAALLPPPLAEVTRDTARPFIQLIFDCAVSRMAFGRVCLIGDAAFVARPHAAAGSAKAAEDAWKLSEAIKEANGDVVTALRSWEAGQLLLGQQVLARTREAGRRFQDGTWPVGAALSFGLYTVGDSTMS